MGYTKLVSPEEKLYRWTGVPQEPFIPVPCSLLPEQQNKKYSFEPFSEVPMDILGKYCKL
jgi:hypothetical protein